MELSQDVEISADVLCQEVSGETVLLDLKSEAYFGLDATATRIWQLIQENRHLQTAFDAMLLEYDVDEIELKKDFSELMAQLSDAGLVVLRPRP